MTLTGRNPHPRPRRPDRLRASASGCMGMSQSYGAADRDESIATIHRALDLGVTLPRHLRRLRQRAQRGARRRGDRRPAGRGAAGDQVLAVPRPTAARRSTAGRRTCGLRRGEPAPAGRRRDRPLLPAPGRPEVPIEDTVGAMAELVAAGQGPPPRAVGGQCRVDPPGGRRPPDRGAAERVVAVDPRPGGGGAAASPASTGSASCRSARSGRGFLTGAITSPRPTSPRTTSGATTRASRARRSPANLRLVDAVRELAAEKGVDGRPAGAGLGARPGRRRRPDPGHQAAGYLEENVGAAAVELSADDLARLDAIAPPGVAAGGRVPRRRLRLRRQPGAHGRVSADRLLVAVFASPVAEVLLRWGAELGFRTRAGRARRRRGCRAGRTAVAGFADLDDELAGGTADVVVTDHHRDELGELLRDALARPARWVGVMGNPRHEGPHVAALDRARGAAGGDRPGAPADRPGHRLQARRRRSPSRRWPGCSPTATAAPAASRTAADRPCPTSCSAPTWAPAA